MFDFTHSWKINNTNIRLLIVSFGLITSLFLTNEGKTQDETYLIKYLESISEYPEDTIHKLLYNKSINLLNADSLETALQLLNHGIKNAKQQKDTSLIGLYYLNQGKVFNKLLNFQNSFLAYHNAFSYSKILKDTTLMIEAMEGIERYYYQLEMLDSAIIYCTRATEINKIQNNYTELSDNYGRLFSYQRYTTGEVLKNTFLLEGLQDSSLSAAIKSGNKELYCQVLIGIALDMPETEVEKAFEYAKAARDSARKLTSSLKTLVYVLTKSSVIYLRYNQTKQARIFLTEALPLAEKLNYTSQLTHINYLFGEILYAEDSVQKAIPYYYKAIALAEKYRHKYYLPYIYYNLFKVYHSSQDFDSSFKFQKKYMDVLRNSLNREMNFEIAKLSAKYQVKQKDESIDNLTIINNQKKIIINSQRRFIISLIVGIIIISTLFFILFKQFRKIRKAHRKLSGYVMDIRRKDKEIAELKKKRDQQLEVVHDTIKTKLVDLFENQEIYLRKNLTLSKTARMLQTNTAYISAIINRDYQCTFNQFVNNFRIEKACNLLSNREMDHYSIEGIADLAGFNSKTVFNKCFKESTGVIPSTFRKSTT